MLEKVVELAALKLGEVPDRNTVNITFTANAELNKLLVGYASAYGVEYGLRESITDLIPHVLKAFVKSDVGFRRKSEFAFLIAQEFPTRAKTCRDAFALCGECYG